MLACLLPRATVESEFGKLAAWNPFFNGAKALEAKRAAALKASHEVVEDLLEKTRKVRQRALQRTGECTVQWLEFVCGSVLH
jgi:hypothetical protein